MTLKIKTQLADLRQYIDEKYKNVTDVIIRNKINDDIERVIEDINIAILEHEIDLNILIDGILFGKQGLIHPRIISPQYLIKNSKHIQEQIPYAEFPVAINKEGIDRLIKMSTLHVAYLQDRLVYILQIPLLTPGKYKLYKSIPLPVRQLFDTTKFATIETEIAHIALNKDADNFYEFRQGELEECIASDSVFICPATFLLKKIRQTPSCDVEILLNKSIKSNKCKIKIMELQDTYWKALTTPGNWIYYRKRNCATKLSSYNKAI
ncbi:hypothetical protein P5V15_010252 [Pogonomyrmex californicus]